MTREAGLEAAVETYRDTYTDIDSVPHEETVAAIIQAYLSASGMVLVPREPTDTMRNFVNRYMNEPNNSGFGTQFCKRFLEYAEYSFKSKP